MLLFVTCFVSKFYSVDFCHLIITLKKKQSKSEITGIKETQEPLYHMLAQLNVESHLFANDTLL